MLCFCFFHSPILYPGDPHRPTHSIVRTPSSILFLPSSIDPCGSSWNAHSSSPWSFFHHLSSPSHALILFLSHPSQSFHPWPKHVQWVSSPDSYSWFILAILARKNGQHNSFLEWSNSARKSVQIFWGQNFSTLSLYNIYVSYIIKLCEILSYLDQSCESHHGVQTST